MQISILHLLSNYLNISVTRSVAWPPKDHETVKQNDGMGEIISSAAKKYVRSVESTNSEQHGQYTMSRGNVDTILPVSYTHLTLPTIYSV